MTLRSADRSGVCSDGTECQPEPGKDLHVRGEHDLVAFLGASHVAIERVRVLHGELAPSHHAEPRTPFIAEFRLDVVEVDRQLAPAMDLVAGDVRDDFFGGRLQNEVAAMPVLHAQQFGAVVIPAAGFDPQLSGLDHGHQQLECACCVHFFAHDSLDLSDDAQPQRHVVVDAPGELADHSRPGHQLVAGDIGVVGCFFESADVESGCAHDWVLN